MQAELQRHNNALASIEVALKRFPDVDDQLAIRKRSWAEDAGFKARFRALQDELRAIQQRR
jgi:hypothetical protein